VYQLKAIALRRKSSGRPAVAGLLIPLLLVCFALAPVAKASPPPKPEDRGNGNSAAENVSALNLSTTGSNNTAHGWFSLFNNTSGIDNTATGYQALFSNTTGINNTANGLSALFANSTGFSNTANGVQALLSNTSGNSNTATGVNALYSNTTGIWNTATGVNALFNNTIGSFNTAMGLRALQNNTTGILNTANGDSALLSNTTGSHNTAIGLDALRFNTTGDDNIALGLAAALTVTTGTGNIHIGSQGDSDDSETIRIGSTFWYAPPVQTRAFIAGIRGVTTANADALPVLIDSAGQLGTASSSHRFKKEIKPMDQASEAILALKPVTFHYKSDATGTPQFGLIAEEVAEVNPNLVVRNADGEIYTVRYDAVNVMLLNEFLKEHRRVTQLRTIVAQQQDKFESKLATQQKQIEVLTAGLQKVSDQIQLRKPPQRMAGNDRQTQHASLQIAGD
jgi:hypothetical protein